MSNQQRHRQIHRWNEMQIIEKQREKKVVLYFHFICPSSVLAMVMHDGAQEQRWRWTKAIRNAILWWNGNHYNNRNTVLNTWRAIWCRWSLAYWWPIESVIVRPVCCAILVSQLHNSLNDSSDRFSVREPTFNHSTNVGDAQTNRQCQSGKERIKNSKNILVLVPCTAPNADKRRLEEKSKSKEKKKRRLMSDFNEVIHSFTFYLILSRIHTSHTHTHTRPYTPSEKESYRGSDRDVCAASMRW